MDSLVEQIPRRSRNWPHVSGAGRNLLLVCLPSRAEQLVVLVVRCYVISQVAPFLGHGCCVVATM
jgi:hypothetical protein